MKFPSPYSWPKACIACGHTDKYQKLFMTSFSVSFTSTGFEMLEIPGNICDRCYASTMKEINEVKLQAKPGTQKTIKKGKDAMVAVFILSVIVGFIANSLFLALIATCIGVVVVAYETFSRIQKQQAKFEVSMNELENPIYRHLRVYRKKSPVRAQRSEEVTVFIFRSSSFMYMFNRANQSFLAQKKVYSLLHENPFDITYSEIDKLILKQTQRKKEPEKLKARCPFCGKSYSYPKSSGGEFDLVKCKNCNQRFIPQ
ncbi:MAG: hypothetical protein RTU63_10230 [Candidatus Thorarchaeota archaeon]